MKLTWTETADPELNPQSVGEYLRGEFFGREKYGCYETMDWAPDVQPLPYRFIPTEREDEIWTCGFLVRSTIPIECMWYWDGDGTLVFRFPDNSVLVNTDCKNDYTWEYHKDSPEWLP